MERGDDIDPRADPHVPADAQPPGAVQKALLPDPGAGPNHHPVSMVPLQDRVMADVHVVADLNPLRMKDAHASLEHDAGAELREAGSREAAVPVAGPRYACSARRTH